MHPEGSELAPAASTPEADALTPLDSACLLASVLQPLAAKPVSEHSDHTYTRASEAHELARRRRLGGGFLNELQRLGRVITFVDDGLAAPVPYQFFLREVALVVDVRC